MTLHVRRLRLASACPAACRSWIIASCRYSTTPRRTRRRPAVSPPTGSSTWPAMTWALAHTRSPQAASTTRPRTPRTRSTWCKPAGRPWSRLRGPRRSARAAWSSFRPAKRTRSPTSPRTWPWSW